MKLTEVPPVLDLHVHLLFEEDVKRLVFPKIREYQFRTNGKSPLEVGAKILSIKNGHPHKWRDYSFSQLRKRVVQKK